MSGSPPLRFLAIVIGGWAAARTAILVPLWPSPAVEAAAAAATAHGRPSLPPSPGPKASAEEPASRPVRARGGRAEAGAAPGRPPDRPPGPAPGPLAASAAAGLRPAGPAPKAAAAAFPAALPPQGSAATAPPPPRRWSLSAWAFVRRGEPSSLAAPGLLGASQAGARLVYRLNGDSARPLSLSLRLSAPLRRTAGAESALGIDWKPARRAPVHVLVERRQALGAEGRSAFAAIVYGGIGDARLGPLRADAYAQAGFVGARSRDPFADGSLRLSVPLGERVRFGAGAWAAAQPGLARLDLGPQAAVRLPVAGRSVTVAADWRIRVAGDAEPGSGPALTVATDF